MKTFWKDVTIDPDFLLSTLALKFEIFPDNYQPIKSQIPNMFISSRRLFHLK